MSVEGHGSKGGFQTERFNAGTELMLLILKARRVARAGALKALNFATTKSQANCDRFIEQQGLRTIFAMFMGKIKVSFTHENATCPSRLVSLLDRTQFMSCCPIAWEAVRQDLSPGGSRMDTENLYGLWIAGASFAEVLPIGLMVQISTL